MYFCYLRIKIMLSLQGITCSLCCDFLILDPFVVVCLMYDFTAQTLTAHTHTVLIF